MQKIGIMFYVHIYRIHSKGVRQEAVNPPPTPMSACLLMLIQEVLDIAPVHAICILKAQTERLKK